MAHRVQELGLLSLFEKIDRRVVDHPRCYYCGACLYRHPGFWLRVNAFGDGMTFYTCLRCPAQLNIYIINYAKTKVRVNVFESLVVTPVICDINFTYPGGFKTNV